MSFQVRNQFLFWMGAGALFLLFVLLFKSVLLPFVLGWVVAYLLEPVVTKLGRYKIGRGFAALLILGLFFLVLGVLALILVPLLYRQSLEFAQDLPQYIDSLTRMLEPFSQKIMLSLGQSSTADLQALLTQNAGSAASIASSVLGGLATGGQVVFGVVSVLIFAPITSYFMMKEWPVITRWMEDLLPRASKSTIMNLVDQINKKIAGFIRGQLSVAFILGFAYAIALSLAGLKYGFLIGLLAGVLSIIPMVGSTVGLLVSVSVAWFQSGDLIYVGVIAAIFLVGQLIEGNILSPKLVGDSVGMHPLWVFFALMAGGALFGILGMLLAVPVAAVAGVLLAFAIARYKMSRYYKAEHLPPADKHE
jgi:predicted PurR-regulated permease PerM